MNSCFVYIYFKNIFLRIWMKAISQTSYHYVNETCYFHYIGNKINLRIQFLYKNSSLLCQNHTLYTMLIWISYNIFSNCELEKYETNSNFIFTNDKPNFYSQLKTKTFLNSPIRSRPVCLFLNERYLPLATKG